MSDYQPKVGDKVMVGEHGPYLVTNVAVAASAAHLNTEVTAATWVPFSWLTPAAEPEPDEPTAPGALVRDGNGQVYVLRWANVAQKRWDHLDGSVLQRLSWENLARPLSILVADPAEVEALREERDQWESDYQEAMRKVDALRAERDGLRERATEERRLGSGEKRRVNELELRIDSALALVADPAWSTQSPYLALLRRILRGES